MNKRILLADDSLTIQKVVELTFMDEEYDVDSVGNGDDAIRQLEEDLPDILIADVHMPGASGYEVCRRAKAMSDALPVLLLVGTFEALDEDEMASSGADGHLKKPFDSQELLQIVLDMKVGEGAAADSQEEDATAELESSPSTREEPEIAEAVSEESSDGDSSEEAPAAGFNLASDETDASDLATETAFEPDELSLEVDQAMDLSAAHDFEASRGAEDQVPDALEADLPEEAEVPADTFDEAQTVLLDRAAFDQLKAQPQASAQEASQVEAAPEVNAEAGEAVAAEEVADEEVEGDDEMTAKSSEEAVPATASAPGALSDDDVERIARRVVELLSDETVREVAWDVVPDLAEIVIKDRVRELEAEAG